MPLADTRIHDIRPGVVCWCSPDMDEDPIIHNSADGREAFEHGTRRPS